MQAILLFIAAALLPWGALQAAPEDDLTLYRDYFSRRFPALLLADFANGAYAIDKLDRDNWLAIEEFPPYAPFIDKGAALWHSKFQNGQGYADCFNGNPAQSKNFPRWDAALNSVITLPLAINQCRLSQGEQPLAYGRGELALLLAYMAYESRGQIIDVKIPRQSGAQTAYENGKAFYFRRRGQLNFACAHCHMESAGQHLRTETISPALGQTSGWPTYRSEWGELGTLHRRFAQCNSLVRAKPFNYQSQAYRELEYFLSYMSNGIPFNGPSARK